ITIHLIDIRVIQEMAVTASLGVAVIILTNLILLPILLSYVKTGRRYRRRVDQQTKFLKPVWSFFERAAEPKSATVIIVVAIALLGFGLWKGSDVKIGDMHRGVPELRTDSRYNRDSAVITEHFSIGVDIISVIVETKPDGCIDYDIMTAIDRFAWHMNNVEGVQSIIGLPGIAKVINAGWNEGSLKWRVLPRNQLTMVQAVGYVPTSSGLLNSDCSVMPVMIFTKDHKAETIANIVSEVKNYRDTHGTENVKFRLATGNVGVMAATNEEVSAAQFPILLYVFGAVILLCYNEFRSVKSVLCIILPLGLVSLLAYALMSILQIGLKVSTLPVVALGVGVGVDYGIYIFSRLRNYLKEGQTLQEAYLHTLAITGNGVVFTGVTLAIGVATWIFSPLKFQADMGILLTFMFLVNMLGAILLLPALACWLLKDGTSGQNDSVVEGE
ncbi:MAG: MMPL family transporter, partial [Desulfuromonadales bacterium]|nr:MMPL family transporter [Desulfuromonadales bacterium]